MKDDNVKLSVRLISAVGIKDIIKHFVAVDVNQKELIDIAVIFRR